MLTPKKILILLLSILLSGMQTLGYYISAKYHTTVHYILIRYVNHESPLWIYVLWFTLQCVVFQVIFTIWFSYLDAKETPKRRDPLSLPPVIQKIVGSPLFYGLVALAMFLCWIPWLLASNPGFFNYDATGQLPQVMYDAPYVNHHPLLHTLLMGHIVNFFYHLKGENLQSGLLAYNLFQMICCSILYTYFIYFLRKIRISKFFQVLAFAYYSLFPTIILFTMSTTKDVLCLSILQLSVLKIYQAFYEGFPTFFRKKRNLLCLVLSLTLACLFRKNVVYAVLLTFICIVLFLRRKGFPLAAMLLCSVALFEITESLLIWGLSAKEGGIAEAFSVPIQQVARVYNQYADTDLTPNEEETIREVIPHENLLNYNPVLSDPVKNFVNFPKVLEEKELYFSLWMTLGARYPSSYISSFLENTYQAWYPGTSIVVNPAAHQIYYFDCDMSLQVERFSKLPGLLKKIEQISKEEYYQKIPLLRLLFSIGAMLWLVIIAFFYGCHSKKPGMLWSSLLVLALCFTNFLGPVSLVRYYLILFYGFPFWISLLFTKGQKV